VGHTRSMATTTITQSLAGNAVMFTRSPIRVGEVLKRPGNQRAPNQPCLSNTFLPSTDSPCQFIKSVNASANQCVASLSVSHEPPAAKRKATH
jgi:hypothetical protein